MPLELASGYGWVQIQLTYPATELESCPGGLAVEDGNGEIVDSAGYYPSGPPCSCGPGVRSGSTTVFVLPVGSFTAIGQAGPEDRETRPFTVTEGQGATVVFELTS